MKKIHGQKKDGLGVMFDVGKLQTAETLKTASGYEAGVVSELLWSKHDSKINNYHLYIQKTASCFQSQHKI